MFPFIYIHLPRIRNLTVDRPNQKSYDGPVRQLVAVRVRVRRTDRSACSACAQIDWSVVRATLLPRESPNLRKPLWRHHLEFRSITMCPSPCETALCCGATSIDLTLPVNGPSSSIALSWTPPTTTNSPKWAPTSVGAAMSSSTMMCAAAVGRTATSSRLVDEAWGENRDGYDTIEWAASQPWSNGDVGLIGTSYGAFNQYTTAADTAAEPEGLHALLWQQHQGDRLSRRHLPAGRASGLGDVDGAELFGESGGAGRIGSGYALDWRPRRPIPTRGSGTCRSPNVRSLRVFRPGILST